MKVADLIPDNRNANRGTQRGLAALDSSLRKHGAGRSILIDKHNRVIAGNKTTERAADIGLDDVIVVETDGSKLVAVKRIDLDLETDKAARELAYADNRVGQLDLEWEPLTLTADLEAGLDLGELFRPEEISAILEAAGTELLGQGTGENYVRNIEPPEYVPTGEKPELSALFDHSRTDALIKEIDAAEGITNQEKEFLRAAAQRHTVFNFKHIAEYYAHSNEELQGLMENSALVIIDFKKAISLGFVQLTKEIAEMVREEYGNE